MFDKSTLRRTFQHQASHYNSGAQLAEEIGRRLLEHLDWMRIKPARILDLGAGTGYITRLLEKRYPGMEIVAVDFADRMLQQFQPDGNNMYRVCVDAEKLAFADASFDLIASNLMLPWCEKLTEVFAEMQRVLKPQGLLLFSTFGPDVLGELRASWATADDSPHVHLFFDQHDLGDALLRAHFADPVMQAEWLTLHYQHAATLFNDLKHTGAYNQLLERRQTLTGKNRWQKFLAEYETYRDQEGNLPATFEIIYGHCWKVEPKNSEGEFRIAVGDIKKYEGRKEKIRKS